MLLIDNSEVGDTIYTPAELKVHYEYDAQNVEVPKETRWDLFIALMVLIVLLGVTFLLLLNMWVQAPHGAGGRGAQEKMLELRQGLGPGRGVLPVLRKDEMNHIPQNGSDFRLISRSSSRVSFSSMFRS